MSDPVPETVVVVDDCKETVGEWIPRLAYNYETYTATRDPELPRGEAFGQWAASGARYEWKEEYGDVAPRDERLEKMLFGDDTTDEPSGAGLDFSK